jgi:MraZ protein
MFFQGEFQHMLDAKGRLAIPARFRDRMKAGAMLVRGVETCLYLYPMETWEEKARALEHLNLTDVQRRMIERRFFSRATECELDAQGRIIVPVEFRRYASLAGETMVVGARDRVEIWQRAAWEAMLVEIENEDLSGISLPF